MVLHLQNFDIIRIVFLEREQRDQHAGKHSLNSFLFIAGSRERQSDASIFFLDADLGLCATYIIDGGFGHGNNGGNGCDDTLFALVDGTVRFERKGKDRRQCSVYALEQ